MASGLAGINVVVIGAGVAGLSCARRLHEAGHRVSVIDKGRGPGGRTSTRRTETGHRFDHGAPHFGIVSEPFRAQVRAWTAAGVVGRRPGATQDLYVGPTGMSAVCKHLATGIDVRVSTRVASVRAADRGVVLVDEHGADLGAFDFAAVAIPPPQAAALLPASSRLRPIVGKVRMQPRWVAMLGFDAEVGPSVPGYLSVPSAQGAFDLYRTTANETGSAWVVQAPRAWSVENLELDAAAVADMLLPVAQEALQTPRKPVYLAAHRWRYAFVETPLGQPCLIDRDERLGIAGDWCLGWNVECAWQSGTTLAELINDATLAARS